MDSVRFGPKFDRKFVSRKIYRTELRSYISTTSDRVFTYYIINIGMFFNIKPMYRYFDIYFAVAYEPFRNVRMGSFDFKYISAYIMYFEVT